MNNGASNQNTLTINPQWNEILQKINDVEQGRASLDSLFYLLAPVMLWMRKTNDSGIESSLIFLLASKYHNIFEEVLKRYRGYITTADLLSPAPGGCLLKVLMMSSDPRIEPISRIARKIIYYYPETKTKAESLARAFRYADLTIFLSSLSKSKLKNEHKQLILSALASQNSIDNDIFGLWSLIAKAVRCAKDNKYFHSDFSYVWSEVKDHITLDELRKSCKGISMLWLLSLLAMRYRPYIFNEVWYKNHQHITAEDLLAPVGSSCVFILLMQAAQIHPTLEPIITEILQRFTEAQSRAHLFRINNTYKQSIDSQKNEQALITYVPVDELQCWKRIEKTLLLITQNKIPADSLLEDLDPKAMRIVIPEGPNEGLSVWQVLIIATYENRNILQTTLKKIWEKYSTEINYYILTRKVKHKQYFYLSILWLLAYMDVETNQDTTSSAIVDIWKSFSNDIRFIDLLFKYNGKSVLLLFVLKALHDEPNIINDIWHKFHDQIKENDLFKPIRGMGQCLAQILIRAANKYQMLNHISLEIINRYQHMYPTLISADYKHTNPTEPEKQIVQKLQKISRGTMAADSILQDLNPFPDVQSRAHLSRINNAYKHKQLIASEKNEQLSMTSTPVDDLQCWEIIEKKLRLITQNKLLADSILTDLDPCVMRMVVPKGAHKGLSLWQVLIITAFKNRRIFGRTLKKIWKEYSAEISYNILISKIDPKITPSVNFLWLLASTNVKKSNDNVPNAIVDIWKSFSKDITLADLRFTHHGKSVLFYFVSKGLLDEPRMLYDLWQKFRNQITVIDLFTPIANTDQCLAQLLIRAPKEFKMLKHIPLEIMNRYLHMYPELISSAAYKFPIEQEKPIIPEKQIVAIEEKKFIYNKIVRKLSGIYLGTTPADSILEDLNSSTIQMVPGSGLSIWWHLLIVFNAVDSRQRRDFEPVFNEIWEKYGSYFTLDDLRSKNLVNNRSVLWMIANMAMAADPGMLLEILTAIWLKFHHNISLDDLRCCPKIEQGKPDKSVLWLLTYLGAHKHYYHYFDVVWQKFSDHFTIDDFRSKTTTGENKGTSIFGLLVFMLPRAKYYYNVWQKFHEEITAEDLLTPIGSDHTLIEMLLQHAQSFHDPLLTAIIEEIFERFSDILSDAKNIAEKANDSPEVHFGIADKYIRGRLPVLPKPVLNSVATLPMYTYKHSFETLNKNPSKVVPKQIVFGSKSASFTGDLYSCTPLNDKESITFICAGRTINALIPQITSRGRCVLVLTAEEFESLKSILPNNLDALVVKSLQSDTHGTYMSLGMITCRRLAIFLCAFNLEIDNFIMLDDNIEHLHFSDVAVNYNDWKSVYTLLLNNLQDYGCISVKTLSPKIAKEDLLGSKMFMINMKEIKKHLCNEQDMYMFFPNAVQAAKWGEDYYMQIMMHELLKPNGYKILEQNTVCLQRSQKNRNVFAKTGAKAAVFEEFNQTTLQQIPAPHRELLVHTLYTINQLINENLLRYKNKEKYLKRVNLLKAHAKANGLKISPFSGSISLSHEDIPFANRFKMAIREAELPEKHFYYYQQDAIKNVADLEDNMGRYEIGTGCGKTRIQCALASIGYHVANDNEHIVIVTPNIQLMKQFYRDFIHYNKTISTQPVPEQAVITVSSNSQSCNIEALMHNDNIKNQKAIMIFCVNSLMNLLASNNAFFKNTSLIFTDEYHEYESKMLSIAFNLFSFKDKMLVGSSATPPENDIFKKTIYSFSRTRGVREKFLAPVIADSLGANYSDENVKNLITALPYIISKRYHPGFLDAKTLSSTKGIVYLPSIEHCEQAKFKLERHGFRVFCIHSKNKTHKQQLNEFMKDEQPGVVVAYRMLKVGFDLPELAWAIIGQKADENDYKSRRKIEQMLGRVTRLKEDKIGYILAYHEVVNIIMPLLKDQPINLSISADYLAQKTVLHSKGVPIFTIESAIFDLDKDKPFHTYPRIVEDSGEGKGLFFTKKTSKQQPSQPCKRSLLPISDRKLRSNKRARKNK